MNLTRIFVQRPTLVTVLVALITLGGVIAGLGLIKQQYPNVDLPTIRVLVTYAGASTTEMRDAIVRPIEDQIAGAPELDHIDTTIQQGQASISVVFNLTSNQSQDLIEVQRRVQAAQSELPADLTTPTIASFDPSQAVVVTLVVTSASLPPGALSSLITDRVAPQLEQLKGVSNVQASGVVTPSLQVEVDPYKLSASGLTITDVLNSVTGNNVRAPGGISYAPNRETNIDIRGDLSTPESVAGLLLEGQSSQPSSDLNRWTALPRLYHVGDVAAVVDGFEPRRSFAYYNGSPAITLNVQKATGASEVTASNSVIAALPALQAQFPDLHFQVVSIQSDYTTAQLRDVQKTLVEAIVLTGLVMLFFLRSWRNAVVVMIAIPTSLFVTLLVMRLANFTLDTVSLLAMTLVIGILVDDSIVVLENVERHHASGEPPQDAAVRGRTEIGFAALVITLVDVSVFLPIAFLPGTVGKFMTEFGFVVVIATLTSLFVSFTITPSLAGNWSLFSLWRPPHIIDRFTAAFERVREWYARRALSWGLRRPGIVVVIAAVSLAAALALVPLGIIGFEFIPADDRGELFVQITLPTGTPLTATRDAVLQLGRIVNSIDDVHAQTSVAGGYQAQFGGFVNLGSVAQIHVFLKNKRQHSTAYWANYIAAQGRKLLPSADIVAIPTTGISGGNSQPIDYLVSTLAGEPDAYAKQVIRVLRGTPGAIDVTSSSEQLAPQVDATFDRDAARTLDVSIGTASKAMRAAFGGYQATQFTTATGLKNVQVVFPVAYQQGLEQARNIQIRADNGQLVHMGDIVAFKLDPAPPLMTRLNRQTVIHVGANVANGASLSNLTRAFTKRLAALHLPANVSVAPNASGNQQNLKDAVSGIGAALALSIVLVYFLMVALYNSYKSPFIVMFSVPVAVVGALGSLALFHQTLNLFSMIGTVMLVGLVTKNGILLVDHANALMAQGLDVERAIRQSARDRFRPIIMTTFAMVMGMLPIALAFGAGSGVRRSLGIVVIGGLTSSLILTLLLVPIVYRWMNRTRGAIPPDGLAADGSLTIKAVETGPKEALTPAAS
jgi:HAE1 family hydrophobic/amphiphilic exporter-1